MTVLLVDDDEDQLMVRGMLLEHHGYVPACANGVEAALEVARQTSPDAAVIDLRLPTESQGWQLITQLRETLPNLPIVVFSGLQKPAAAEAARVDEWITKGGGTGLLLQKLSDLASGRK